ncbi:MAG: ABC transporter permease subunit [Thermoplasmata archaeon]
MAFFDALSWHYLSNVFSYSVLSFVGYIFYLAGRSFLRMFLAYLLSILFSYTYGLYAAVNKTAEKILIPILDILQSVPILGFFPVVILLLISLFNNSIVGLELAAIFLIFTSQSWNMAFGVYQSVLSIPEDIDSACRSFGITGWKKFRSVLVPATIPSFVSNSMVSWSAGWYFLMASEIITVSANKNYYLPGLGSAMFIASSTGNIALLLSTLFMLIFIIILMEFLVWKPMIKWSNNFKYDIATSDGDNAPLNKIETWERDIIRLITKIVKHISEYLKFDIPAHKFQRIKSIIKTFSLSILLLFIGVVLYYFVKWFIAFIFTPIPPIAYSIPIATLFSLGRLVIAYLISLIWTIPLGYYIGKRLRGADTLETVSQLLAAIPATALYPIILLLLLKYINLEGVSIFLITTGMEWYILFNVIAGVRAIPSDIDEAMRSYGIKGWLYWKKVVLPAIFPYLVTGSITAFGGGWNALIVSEYLIYGNNTYHVMGIGYLIDVASDTGNYSLLFLSLIGMVFSVVLINRLFWKRLYRLGIKKFKIEY